MTLSVTRLKGTKPVSWTTILGLVLVPLTVAGILLWGLWKPNERFDTMTAAVVNNDQPVEVDGQTVPLGRVLAGELMGGGADTGGADTGGADTGGADGGGENFTWQLSDTSDAQQGLADGRYATVITIPKNFSAAATSLSGGPEKAQTAHIDISESTQGRLLDTALSNIVTQAATAVLNQQLGEQFVGNVFVGMNELHSGIGKAADGATKLADGGTQLSSGASQLATGTAQLSEGTQQLSTGVSELSTGAGSLATGVSELAAGATDFAAGARVFASGDGAALPGMAGLASSTSQYTAGVNEALTGLQQGSAGAVKPLQQFRALVAAGVVPIPPETTQAKVLADLDALIAGMQSSASTHAEAPLELLKTSGVALAGGMNQVAVGADQLAAGAEGLAAGARQVSTGASELAAGTGQLSLGASDLATGTPDLAAGAAELADGVSQSAEGAKDLSKGLGETVAGIPNYTQAERETLAQKAVTPVETRGGSDEIFTSGGAPLFAGIALWAGALASFLVIAPLWRRTRNAARGVGYITMRSALPAVLIGALQGAIAGVIMPAALGYGLSQATAFFGFALLAGVSFGLVVQGASALFGGVGRFIAFALLVVAFAVGVVSTVPGPLATVGDLSPVGSALSGFQAIASGSTGAGGAAVLLAVWGGFGLFLTACAAGRMRRARG